MLNRKVSARVALLGEGCGRGIEKYLVRLSRFVGSARAHYVPVEIVDSVRINKESAGHVEVVHRPGRNPALSLMPPDDFGYTRSIDVAGRLNAPVRIRLLLDGQVVDSGDSSPLHKPDGEPAGGVLKDQIFHPVPIQVGDRDD